MMTYACSILKFSLAACNLDHESWFAHTDYNNLRILYDHMQDTVQGYVYAYLYTLLLRTRMTGVGMTS